MRSRRPASSARTWFVCRRLRFRLVAFLVRMWLLLAWPHLYLPEAVFRKRLAAARLVLILGIGVSLRNLELAWAVASSSWERPRFPSCPCRWVGHRSTRNRRRVLGEAKARRKAGPDIMTWRRSRRNAPFSPPSGEKVPRRGG